MGLFRDSINESVTAKMKIDGKTITKKFKNEDEILAYAEKNKGEVIDISEGKASVDDLILHITNNQRIYSKIERAAKLKDKLSDKDLGAFVDFAIAVYKKEVGNISVSSADKKKILQAFKDEIDELSEGYEGKEKKKKSKGAKDDVEIDPKDSVEESPEEPKAAGEKDFKDFHDKNTKVKKHPVEENWVVYDEKTGKIVKRGIKKLATAKAQAEKLGGSHKSASASYYADHIKESTSLEEKNNNKAGVSIKYVGPKLTKAIKYISTIKEKDVNKALRTLKRFKIAPTAIVSRITMDPTISIDRNIEFIEVFIPVDMESGSSAGADALFVGKYSIDDAKFISAEIGSRRNLLGK